MGISQSKVMTGNVMHARLIPARNVFNYGIYYIALPLSELAECEIPQERFSLTSFYAGDHGACDGSPLLPWAKDILAAHGIVQADGDIVLVCMPRILGYVFNPISFWVCYDTARNIRAVICDVRNTFGERHVYLCARADHQPIRVDNPLVTKKIFHVSPFLKREGHYRFVFDINDTKFDARIDYFDAAGQKTLATSLTGYFAPLTRAALRQAFFKHPLVTFKAIALIHWQALKLISKGIRHIRKPPQIPERFSATDNITQI